MSEALKELQKEPQKKQPRKNAAKVWVAYYVDWSDAAVFTSEIACRRHAMENEMRAAQIPLGVNMREAVR